MVGRTPVHALAGALAALVLAAALAARPGGTRPAPDTVYVAMSETMRSFDPHVTTSASDFRVLSQVYDGLLTHAANSFELAPGLAKSWQVDADGKAVEFALRQDVRFHDGTLFDAEAVRFNFERMLREDHPFHATGPFPLAFLFDKIRRVHVQAPFRVRLELSEPYAPLLSNLTYPAGFMVSPTAVRRWGKAFGMHGGGTGPYRLHSGSRSDGAVLERMQPNAPGAHRIVFRTIVDPMTALAELATGGVDAMVEPPTDTLSWLGRHPKLSLQSREGAHSWFLIVNVRRPFLGDARVRRALNYAVDREGIAHHVLQGGAAAAVSVMPKAFGRAHDDKLRPYPHDPDRARALLKAAGVVPPLSLRMVVPTSGSGMLEPELMAAAIQADLRRVGVQVSVTAMEWNAYLAFVNTGLDEKTDLAAMAWMTNDPDTLPTLALTRSSHPPQGFNSGWYENPHADELLEEARGSFDAPSRSARYRELDALFYHDAPWVFVVSQRLTLATTTRISGARLLPSFLLDLRDVEAR